MEPERSESRSRPAIYSPDWRSQPAGRQGFDPVWLW